MRDGPLGDRERMIERAGAIHRYEAGAKDGERHDLPSASVLDRYHEQHYESDDGQHRTHQVGHAVDWLAERDTKFHDEKLLKQWIEITQTVDTEQPKCCRCLCHTTHSSRAKFD